MGKQTSLHDPAPAQAKRENSYLYCGRCRVLYVEESHRKVIEHRNYHYLPPARRVSPNNPMHVIPLLVSTSQQIGLKKLGRFGIFLEHDDLPYASIPVRIDIAGSP